MIIDAENTQNVCNRDPPGTSASKTPGDNGFRIKLAGRPQVKYTPRQVYTGELNTYVELVAIILIYRFIAMSMCT